ncbi:dephospho-CoA kinase [Pectobacterium carotovorum]|uniref:dephospho-CoA kinase n=1 Tax=Pectobacterium TaxID=122277 RepID=UPI0005069719|nr:MULTISPECIES: dephospho-CoA kinase [Pectobacterium]KFX01649.1 dephospho-CoA kinase [Pectobacterium carotovorum subsp. carotovorum]KML66823.1 dephospho-CoA kinase [Pectobacterium carotovorum subsp. carotovorum ICMP 5702]MBE5215108.1 dephospho-CoA kinase [Pectobacterium quasiaquaticum]MBE5224536.1 dephospho-CoA kinase [Pectobacterium quasiaquaticum]MCA6971323.1 dephospho-CoA kinase [Pectobacterium carotovorum]
MTYIVALTGGIGSGKSTVADEFATLGATIVDADIIARQVVEPGKPALDAIRLRFGDAMLNTDGSLDRAALRQRIFSSPAEKQWLNNLLHPLIHQETQAQFQVASAPYILWVVPLLVENGLQQRAQRILVVDVDKETQLARTLARDGISRQQAENILAAQATREQRLAYADDIIDNSRCPNELAPQVAELHRQYLELAASAADRMTKNE